MVDPDSDPETGHRPMAGIAGAGAHRGRGAPMLWIGAGVVAVALLIVFGALGLIAGRGLAHFWPAELEAITYEDAFGGTISVLGSVVDEDVRDATGRPARTTAAASAARRELVRSGNRDLAPPEFRWIATADIAERRRPEDATVLERASWGNAHGYVDAFLDGDDREIRGRPARLALDAALERADAAREDIRVLRRERIAPASDRLQALRAARRRDATAPPADDARIRKAEAELRAAEAELRAVEAELARERIRFRTPDGRSHLIPMAEILRAWQPNAMGPVDRAAFTLVSVWQFLSGSPREANTEGGIFPAIFGTVLLVLLMALLVTPLGVITAVYLHEYAKPGLAVRTLRIAVNNLAGVPSIVYGVFGLGFFVYVLGGSIDALLFADTLPNPTFGSPGLLWAALTLALLTVPVVIVSTEEGLARIPQQMREGALALGATRSETLRRIVLPSATPAILTGVILAVARAAGEVAPLMLVGVVKLAPQLPLDGSFPYLHLDRQFMHLGFHIYDAGFQSPNVEAARPLVFATALLLVLIIVALNLLAIVLRSRLQRRYGAAGA